MLLEPIYFNYFEYERYIIKTEFLGEGGRKIYVYVYLTWRVWV
jgi:hypothetical protein